MNCYSLQPLHASVSKAYGKRPMGSLSESLDSEKSKDQLDSFFIADNQKNEDVFFVKVLHSNFSEEETLTKYLNSTIPKDQTHLSGRGQFVEVDGNEKHNEDEKTCRNFCSSFLCYFCAINNINASDELELVDGTSSLNSTNPFKRDLVRNGYIIAFCYDSQDEHSNFLPFFASELDNFCEELTPLFFDNRSEDLSHALLEKASLWYYTNIEFLSRSCQLLKDRLCHFLYATTTVPFSIRVIGEDNERKKDIEKLLKVCFINETAETSSYTLELLTNDTFEFNCDESNEFCMNFSEELIKIISTTCCALHLRAVLEDFKSKVVNLYCFFL
ncbi:uncharacterized protein LOC135146441 [Zophobas morio]|uniref:uncharacterized protein LOC135146441 n=1 Tax=Zophobas morio TaxID=2755281 RepID=UPI003082740D